MNHDLPSRGASCAYTVQLASLVVLTSVSLLLGGCGTANSTTSSRTASDGASGAVMSNREAISYAATNRKWYEKTLP